MQNLDMRKTVNIMLRQRGYCQYQLALAIDMSPETLNRKLKGRKQSLTAYEFDLMIEQLEQWGCFVNRQLKQKFNELRDDVYSHQLGLTAGTSLLVV